MGIVGIGAQLPARRIEHGLVVEVEGVVVARLAGAVLVLHAVALARALVAHHGRSAAGAGPFAGVAAVHASQGVAGAQRYVQSGAVALAPVFGGVEGGAVVGRGAGGIRQHPVAGAVQVRFLVVVAVVAEQVEVRGFEVAHGRFRGLGVAAGAGSGA